MGYHHCYKLRDFDFAHQLVTLRKRTGLTQEEIALQIGVAVRSIRNWEGGSNYPSDVHMQKLIELYLDKNAFEEYEEARTLWDQLRESSHRRIGIFDEQWFAALLQAWQARSPTQPSAGSQQRPQPWSAKTHRPVPFPALETKHQNASLLRPSSRLLQGDWSEAFDVSSWYGRTDELAELEHWLLTDRCRLVAVLGMGGIGKTTLAVKLMRQVASHFERVLWRSLHNAPTLEDILQDWLPILAEQHNLPPPHSVEQGLALLIGLLQERHCLLVLDNLETVLQEGMPGGTYRQGYEEYATLIQYVAETAHGSCLLLTGREKFPDLGVSTGRLTPVRMFRLGGLALPACQQMLQSKGLIGNQEGWSDLVQRYSGNPLALKIVAETVYDLFGGDIAAFLAEGFTTFHGIRQLLSQQFERLSALEQALMYWLAIEREPITLETLREDLQSPATRSEVMEAMHSLRSRSLVERGEQGAIFTLQPAVLEYVTERLVERVSEEIREGQPGLLLTHALLQNQVKDYLRSSQGRLHLQAVLDRLLPHFGNHERLETQLALLLQQLRALPSAKQGYGGGNVVNLLVRLNGHIKGKDCSQLAVWQADLQGAEAQDASFAGADLAGSAFMETSDSIVSVALSPDGQYVASGSNTGELRLWRVRDGQLLQALQAHSGLVWSLIFHPESTRLVSGGYDGLVKVWEVSSGQCVHILRGHTHWIGLMAIHPAGRLLATCSDDWSIRLWDLTDGHCLKIWHEHEEVWSVAFSPDGRLLASSYGDGMIKLRDHASEACLWSVAAHHDSGVFSVAFSPDGELLASGGEDATIMVWETSTGKHLSTLSEHTDLVRSVTFNAEGLLASSGFDRTVKLWKIGHTEAAAQCLGTLHGHNNWIWSATFGPNGLLVSGDVDGVLKLWQISREGEGGKCLRTLHGYSRLINTIAFSPDGSLLVSNESSGTVRLWETRSGQCLRVFSKQTSGFSAVAFSPDGHLLVQSLPDKTIKLWEVESGQCVRTLQGHQNEIWSVIFSADGRFLLSGSHDKTAKLWEVESGRCLKTLEGHTDWIWSVACSPDGRLLASGDVDGMVKLWEMSSGRCLHSLQGSPKDVLALTFTPDSSRLLSSNAQDLVTIWDVQSGDCLRTVPGIGETYWVGSLAFSADGSLLATVSSDQNVKLWDVSSGTLLHTFFCDAGRPWPVAFSADQQLLACGTDEGTILLWERQTERYLMTLRSDGPYERMNITGVTGVTEAQKASLKALGAFEEGAGTKPE